MRAWVAAAVCGLLGLAGLAGCAGGAFAPGSAGSQTASGGGAQSSGATLTGKVRGGQQPIVGAHVYLLAANTTGYGGNGMAASASNASVSLLTSGTGTTLDTSGGATNGDYYVTTDGTGNWTITGDYTCTAGQQVYLYALGGNPGAGANAAAGLLAALGTCPNGGNFLSGSNPISYVVINEVSTVATAYAFAGFATDATHVSSSGTALAQTGIANAFANAANLETLSTGAALATTPAGNGTVPQSEIYTLANILASCVNSNGAGSTACTTLFADTTADGTLTGAQASDTATAAIDIAHNPGVNVASLYALMGGTPPFGGGLSAAPNDWTVAINFANSGRKYEYLAIDAQGNVWVTGGNTVASLDAVFELSNAGATTFGSTFSSTFLQQLAFDNSGNAWIIDLTYPAGFQVQGGVIELSPSGTLLSAAAEYTGGGLNGPQAIALDAAGDAWVTNYANTVTQFSPSGTPISGSSGFAAGGTHPESVAIDGSGNVWMADFTQSSVSKLSGSGSLLWNSVNYTGGMYDPNSIAIDRSGNAWIASFGATVLAEFSNAGSLLSGPNGFSGGGLGDAAAIAIDGAGNIWVANLSGSISEFSNTGTPLSGSGGFEVSGLQNEGNIAIDGAGNVWVTNEALVHGYPFDSLIKFIGAATPVITPIAAGLPAVPTVDGSSKLGTRP